MQRLAAIMTLAGLVAACEAPGASSGGEPCPGGLCATSSSSSGSGGGQGCDEQWTCTAWQKGSDGLYSRSCTDDNMCGTSDEKPPEGPLALPELDKNAYMCEVEPIFDRSCAHMGCHGTERGRVFKIYARGRLRNAQTVPQVPSCPLGPQMLDLQEEGSGTVMCLGWSPHTPEEWQLNFDNARAFMIGISDPAESELLKQPQIGGGFAHAGVHTWSPGDADYQILHDWLAGKTLASCDPSPN